MSLGKIATFTGAASILLSGCMNHADFKKEVENLGDFEIRHGDNVSNQAEYILGALKTAKRQCDHINGKLTGIIEGTGKYNWLGITQINCNYGDGQTISPRGSSLQGPREIITDSEKEAHTFNQACYDYNGEIRDTTNQYGSLSMCIIDGTFYTKLPVSQELYPNPNWECLNVFSKAPQNTTQKEILNACM